MHWFSFCLQISKPQLAERLNFFFQPLQTMENKNRIVIKPGLMIEIGEIYDVPDKC